jgi:AraC-like DNA-binding protein
MERPPHPLLRPFVRSVWHGGPALRRDDTYREHMAPSAEMHVAFRLRGPTIRLLEGDSATAHGHAVVSGLRAGYYVKEVAPATITVGAQLRPGAARALLGATADELAGRHVRLGDLWGDAIVDAALSEMHGARRPEERLRIMEAFLVSRVRPVRGIHPAVAESLVGFDPAARVADLVQRSGYSHRAFIAMFRQEVGLPPKLYARVLRFRRTLERLESDPAIDWAQLALEAGYSDQAHFTREFREFAGVTPEEYRRIAPAASRHIPVNSVQDGAAPAP